MTKSSVNRSRPRSIPGGADHRAILCAQTFCPVASVVAWPDDELVRLVNDTEFGPLAYVRARDLKRAPSWPN